MDPGGTQNDAKSSSSKTLTDSVGGAKVAGLAQVTAADGDAPPEPPDDDRDLLDYLADEVQKAETWWSLITDETSVNLLRNADGVPDIAITLQMLKGFGREVPVPPLQYVIPGDKSVR